MSAVRTRRRESDEALFERYQCHDDLSARDELIRRFLPLANRLARHYEGGSEPLEDLVQVAAMALVKAVDRFDTERGSGFVGYAVPTILGELKRHFRNCGWAVHVPRGMQERVLKISAATDELSADLGRSPTPQQLAAATGLPTEQVLEGLEASRAYRTVSFDAEVRKDDDGHATYADTLGETDPRFDTVDSVMGIRRGLNALPERERTMLYLRFMLGLTQVEIAKRLGISQMHVSRLLQRALDRVQPFAQTAPRPSRVLRAEVGPAKAPRAPARRRRRRSLAASTP